MAKIRIRKMPGPAHQAILLIIDAEGESYGNAILKKAQEIYGISMAGGTMQQFLKTSLSKGLLESRWGEERDCKTGPPQRRYYWLTEKGKKVVKLIKEFQELMQEEKEQSQFTC